MLLSKLNKNPKPNQLDAEYRSFSFEAIGTFWQITIEQSLAKSQFNSLVASIEECIGEFDHNYSRFRADSLISKMAKQADAKILFDLYQDMYKLSHGLMTPLVGQLLSDAGYDANYSLKPKRLSQVVTWEEALSYNFPDITIKCPALIDLGAAGKGYLVDIIGNLIEGYGVTKFCVNAGGDILNRNVSDNLSRIGLEHPLQSDEVIGIAQVENKSICGSAGNRRAWANFNHIINPKTKQSPNHILAIWVVADTTIVADALATALYFVDAKKLAQHYDFSYALVKNDLSLDKSDDFPASFFTEQKEAGQIT
jgi:thiamine biosynthesis lipoprotein